MSDLLGLQSSVACWFWTWVVDITAKFPSRWIFIVGLSDFEYPKSSENRTVRGQNCRPGFENFLVFVWILVQAMGIAAEVWQGEKEDDRDRDI